MAVKLDLCERCGECCRFKIDHLDFFVAEDRYCPHFQRLSDGKGSCKIYDKHTNFRIDDQMICLPSARLAKAGLLPESCPYAKAIPGYRCRVINYGKTKFKQEVRSNEETAVHL
jgi:uncharacterized cysteine cluster protein YcgN (CxxCxxCC family)